MEQRSNEWHAARSGRLTASRFADVIAGKDTKRRRMYMKNILLDLREVDDFELDSPWFKHGQEWEDEARERYEFETERSVTLVGLITHPVLDYVAASPDGLVGEDGGIEIKCHKSYPEFVKVRDNGIPARHLPQVQGNMWVTGRKWWDFIGYWKGLRQGIPATAFTVRRIERDDDFIKRLMGGCEEFWAEVQAKLKEMK